MKTKNTSIRTVLGPLPTEKTPRAKLEELTDEQLSQVAGGMPATEGGTSSGGGGGDTDR